MTQAAAKKTLAPLLPFLREIDILVRARYPVLYLLTHEEARLETMISELARRQNKELFTWTATRGLHPFRATRTPTTLVEHSDPIEVLAHIQSSEAHAIYLLKDFHPFLDDPHVTRRLRDVAHELKNSYKTILIAAPKLNLPVELEKEISIIDVPLPTSAELLELLRSVCRAVGADNRSAIQLSNDDAIAIVRAAQGLTVSEAENVFAKAVVNDSVLDRKDVSLILEEKKRIIRKSGVLDFHAADSNLNEIGGLANLKHWLKVRGKAFQPKAAEFGLPSPKGVLLLGAPGCGKSLTAKAVAQAWQMPLVRLDFGKIFSGLVGSSEENMRRALQVAEGVAPAVLWIDEIEKGLAGNHTGSSDGGTAARVFGTFLTWMQEKSAKVFVVATANRIESLPPELLRRGRFDEIFFMDLPESKARQEILEIHLRKKKRAVESFDLTSVIVATDGFSGAEIEHCITEALFDAFHANRELTTADLIAAAKRTVPLSVTYTEELSRTRAWAKNRARPADSTGDKSHGK